MDHPHRRHDDAPLLPEAPMFARARNDANDRTELRVEIPKDWMSVIDATWMSRGDAKSNRNSLANEIIGEWVRKKWHEASVVMRTVPCNPVAPESGGEGI